MSSSRGGCSRPESSWNREASVLRDWHVGRCGKGGMWLYL
eukprot:gene26052-biopygen13328